MNNVLAFGYGLMSSPVTAEKRASQPVTPERQAQEHTWAVAAQAGDGTAFMAIVEAYQRPVYNLCYRMLGDPAEAEDATQETFLRVYTKLKTYDPSQKFSSWLLSIASHYCIDRLRKRRYQLISWDDLPPWRWLPDTGLQPEQAAVRNEFHDEIHALLEILPEDYRAAIVLRYWYDMSYEEMAQTLRTTVSAIKSRLFRARQMLAQEAEEAHVK